MANRKFYVVWEGRCPGIYDSWEECHAQIDKFPSAKYKSFSSQEEATIAFRGDPREQLGLLKAIAERNTPIVNYSAFPEIELDAIAVDAACSGNPGRMEYRGVDVRSGIQLFHVGPFEDSTNNIGEFLAIVHALAMCKKQGISTTIYSDSLTALAWVRNRATKTKLKPTQRNAKTFELLNRALNWLAHNTYDNRVVKWKTEEWGEIPADFGRK